MMRTIALSLLATVMVSAATVNRADASVAGPAKGLATFAPDELITQARWVCNAYRCEWHAFLPGEVHPWCKTLGRTPHSWLLLGKAPWALDGKSARGNLSGIAKSASLLFDKNMPACHARRHSHV